MRGIHRWPDNVSIWWRHHVERTLIWIEGGASCDIHLQHYVESKPKKLISDWWLPTYNHFVKLYVAIIICWIVHDKFCWESYHRGNTWWRHQMITFAALMVICAGNSLVTGEFPAQRPVARSFDAFFDLRLNKRLSKQWWGWWFETLSRPL